jgi:predicted O-methyltransferase YrrM
MGWSPESAAQAYTETVKLCKVGIARRHISSGSELHSTEFLAALAGGIEAKLIVQVTSSVRPATVALAVAARKTGGRLICILSDPDSLLNAMLAMDALNLSTVVEFLVGDATEILPQFSDVDFALVDCRREQSVALFDLLRLNSSRAVLVAENLFLRSARAGFEDKMSSRAGFKPVMLPIGKGIEVARLARDEKTGDFGMSHAQGRGRTTKKVSWAMDMAEMLHY